MDIDLDISLESDAEEVTAAEVFASMEEIWMNEKFSPEILPNQMDVVDCMYLQIQTMEKNISGLEKHNIIRRAHELELIRIRFMLTSYLRTRLMKIEMYAQTILEQDEERLKVGHELYLTEHEKTFAMTFNNMLHKYIDNIFKFIPGYVPDESKEQPMKPVINSFVFFQSKKVVEGVIVDEIEDDLVDIREGSKMIMPYSSIMILLKNGDVKLI